MGSDAELHEGGAEIIQGNCVLLRIEKPFHHLLELFIFVLLLLFSVSISNQYFVWEF